MKRTDLSIIMRTAWQMCRATGVTCGCKAYKGADNNRDSLLIVKYDAVVLEIIRCKGCVKKRP